MTDCILFSLFYLLFVIDYVLDDTRNLSIYILFSQCDIDISLIKRWDFYFIYLNMVWLVMIAEVALSDLQG